MVTYLYRNGTIPKNSKPQKDQLGGDGRTEEL
jgi:hypothetical protein